MVSKLSLVTSLVVGGCLIGWRLIVTEKKSFVYILEFDCIVLLPNIQNYINSQTGINYYYYCSVLWPANLVNNIIGGCDTFPLLAPLQARRRRFN